MCDIETMLEEQKYSCFSGALGEKGVGGISDFWLLASFATWCTLELGLDTHMFPSCSTAKFCFLAYIFISVSLGAVCLQDTGTRAPGHFSLFWFGLISLSVASVL